MLFNSYGFVFCFCPLALIGYWICKEIGKRLWGGVCEGSLLKGYLFVVSLIFYGWQHPEYLPVLIGSMAVNYGLFWQMERKQNKKPLLIGGLVFNLGILGLFKYVGDGSFVPLGISFFTFTQIAFLMECYRGSLKQVSVLSYGLYVGFFPKVMQGPIALPEELLSQFDSLKKRLGWEQIYRSLFLFVLGLSKKVLIADTLGKAADFGYANLASLNSGDGLIVMLSYTLQLYFDFSGYCDMAMGIARLFGVELPLNFNSPYKASNIVEFWKGWHITLTRFFTKYLYIPLGGNRKGKGRTYLNYLIVFFLSGIWHGAGISFVVWGMMHGVLYVVTKAWQEWRPCRRQDLNGAAAPIEGSVGKKGLPKAVQAVFHSMKVLFTFLYVNIAWIFFRAPSVQEAVSLLKTIFSFRFGRINWNLAGCFNLDEFWYVIKVLHLDLWQYGHYILMVVILTAVLLLVFFGENAVNLAKKVKPGVWQTVLMAVLFVWSVLSFSGVSSFLYVNF